MSEHVLTDPVPAQAHGRTRSHVLELVRSATDSVSVVEIADATGLHRNTARFHLDGLVESGLVQRDSEAAGRPGRPRTVYRATPGGAQHGTRSYRLLAEMLTGMVTEDGADPGAAAVAAGAAWGRYLVQRPAPSARVDAADGVHRLRTVLAEAGFAPEMDTESDSGEREIGLRQCPFLEIAEQHREVVCSLHLGLMRGALSTARAPLAVERLEPFAEPSRCVARLVSAAPASPYGASDGSADR